MTKTVEDADQVNDNTFGSVTAEGVNVDNCDADVLENKAIRQQEDKYETSTDKIATTGWTTADTADNETSKTSQIKVKQVRRGGEF